MAPILSLKNLNSDLKAAFAGATVTGAVEAPGANVVVEAPGANVVVVVVGEPPDADSPLDPLPLPLARISIIIFSNLTKFFLLLKLPLADPEPDPDPDGCKIYLS